MAMPWCSPGGHALARPGAALVVPGLALVVPGLALVVPGLALVVPGLAGASMGGPRWRRHFGGTPRRIASEKK
jgi:hypothetical protein